MGGRESVMSKTLHEQLLEFHAKVGQPILDKPQVPDEARIRLRAALIAEEFFETMEAMFARTERNNLADIQATTMDFIKHGWILINMPSFADGLADLDYVIEGTRIEFGIDGAPIAAEVHRANMAKAVGPTGRDGPVAGNGKILKPPGWKPPDIEGELRKQGWRGE
jgi:predicted HAD superfamily Cof-like phosphohydrolase